MKSSSEIDSLHAQIEVLKLALTKEAPELATLRRRLSDIADAFGLPDTSDQSALCVAARAAGAKIEVLTRERDAYKEALAKEIRDAVALGNHIRRDVGYIRDLVAYTLGTVQWAGHMADAATIIGARFKALTQQRDEALALVRKLQGGSTP